jgi:hypothetical protein
LILRYFNNAQSIESSIFERVLNCVHHFGKTLFVIQIKFVPAPTGGAVGVKITFVETALIGKLITFDNFTSETLFCKIHFCPRAF